MKARWFSLLSLVIILLLLLPGGVWPTAAQSRPVAPMNQTNQTPPGDAAMLAPQTDGTWINYTNGNYVNALAVEGDYVWAGTHGGVVRWNRTDGSYVKYTTTDGLAGNAVYAIAIDGADHLWFGTNGGVSEFDGSTWTTYTTADGLAHNLVLAIAVDGAGHMWFGTYGGASEFDGSTWTTYTTADGLADNYVWSITVDGADHLWFGTWGGGVSEFDGSTWTTYTTADGLAGNAVYAIAIDGADHLWFGASGGVSEFDGSTWTTYTTADGLAHNLVLAIAVDGAGHMWFGTYGGVSEFDGSTWTTYTTADGLAGNDVWAIAVDGAGHLWFGSYWGGGVSEFDGSTWTTYTTADGLASNRVYPIAVDGADHLWFGTWGGGVSKFDGSTWTTYTPADGLAGHYVRAIAVDGAGHMWFGTRDGGVSEFDGSTWTTYTTADGLANNGIHAIAVDGAGHKWFGFGVRGGGVSEFDGSTWTTYTTADGLASNYVNAIAIDGAGHMWFGTGGGVSEYDGSTWTTYTTADGLADNRIWSIAIDGAGHKWFGTYDGVSEYDGSTWTTYTTADGLAHNDVGAIAIDGAGHMWFGTGGGVSEFDGSTWTTYTTADGLANNGVNAIAVDGADHLWFGTWGGVSEFIPGGVGPTYYLSGTVIDATTNDPLSDVQISISGPSQAITTTAADGLYTFENLPAGQYQFEARKEGYDTVTTLVYVASNACNVYNPLMSPAPTSYEDLAGHYAPVWYQDVDATDHDADYITNFDFDGNWNGGDNWQHQNDEEHHPLKAYIYYSVIETKSHYFIMYADFHPRDWGGVGLESWFECIGEYISPDPVSSNACHENDMEGALVVVRKEDGKPYGEFHLMATVFHTGFTFYSDSGDVQFFDDTHPMLYVEPKGHGVQAYDISHFEGDGVIIYVYEAGNAGAPPKDFLPGTWQTVKYDMKYIKDVLWARRHDFMLSEFSERTYKAWGLFEEDELFFPVVGARPPWGWGGGEAWMPIIVINSLFQDPAHLIPRELDDLDVSVWSYEYIYNPYLAVKIVISLLGGSLTSNDGSTEVRMPAGISTSSIKLTHTPLVDDGSSVASSDSIEVGSASQTAMSAGDLANVSHGFELTAEFLDTGLPVTSLQKPYEITFRYSDDEATNVFEDSLALYWWDGSEWVAEPTSAVDEANNTVTATPGHLGLFAVLGTPKTTIYLPLVLRNY